MKEFWVREVVGKWEVPAPAFDSPEVIPEDVNDLLPLNLQNELFDAMAEEQTLDEDLDKVSFIILGPISKNGRKVFVASKTLYHKI